MFHGAQSTDGPSIQTFGYFFTWFVGSIFISYYAMKFTATRREAKELALKRSLKGR